MPHEHKQETHNGRWTKQAICRKENASDQVVFVRLVQHLKIAWCNTPYKQTKGRNPRDYIKRPRKHFATFNMHSWQNFTRNSDGAEKVHLQKQKNEMKPTQLTRCLMVKRLDALPLKIGIRRGYPPILHKFASITLNKKDYQCLEDGTNIRWRTSMRNRYPDNPGKDSEMASRWGHGKAKTPEFLSLKALTSSLCTGSWVWSPLSGISITGGLVRNADSGFHSILMRKAGQAPPRTVLRTVETRRHEVWACVEPSFANYENHIQILEFNRSRTILLWGHHSLIPKARSKCYPVQAPKFLEL